jgi:hypothetical protein
MMIHTNKQHASLCQTGFTRKIQPLIAATAKAHINQKFLDLNIWKLPVNKLVFLDSLTCVGIKGMPGRGGIGYGHKDQMGSVDERPFKNLEIWIGKDADNYKNLVVTKKALC